MKWVHGKMGHTRISASNELGIQVVMDKVKAFFKQAALGKRPEVGVVGWGGLGCSGRKHEGGGTFWI